MPDARPLIERVLDLVVYAPVGLLTVLKDDVPKLAAEGREKFENRVQVARFIGELSVQYGKQEVAKRVAARDAARLASPPDAAQHLATDADVAADAVAEVAAIPFDGYDTMAAAHIVQRLRGMTDVHLAGVAAYEAQHRNRRTILAKVDQLRSV